MQSEYGGATLDHDGAYWVSDIGVVDPASDDGGLVDVLSLARCDAESVAEAFHEPGTEPDPHVRRGTRWTETGGSTGPEENGLETSLDGVAVVTLWPEIASLGLVDQVPLATVEFLS